MLSCKEVPCFSKICRWPTVKIIAMYLVVAAYEAHFCDFCRNMGHFLCGVERVKRFVNVHLHCIVSNLEMIGKISTLSPPGKMYADVQDNRYGHPC